MVQRKVADRLGIQADRLSDDHISLKKPSTSQHQDGKNRLPDLKKKMMKKSRSFKLSDIGHQSLKSSTSSVLRRNNISQPGKPPPTLDIPTILLTPKKQTPITKTVDSSPNYMKSTSCFDARREPQSSQVSSLRRNSTNSQVVSSSSNNTRPTKSSTKTSSSKLVRTLIRTPSFKPSRPASSKKSARVSLCTSDDHLSHVQGATCSSTLKDSKFPSYLMLNHGGTESEGTSVIEVCPYTYCSLNGHHHHHASLPPMKRFLSAKRRSLKNQQSLKLTAPSENGIKEIDEEDAEENVGIDIFVEIYAKNVEDEDEKRTDFMSSKGEEEEEEHYSEEQVVESPSDGSPQSEIDTDESPERCPEEIVATDSGIVKCFYEDEDAEKDYVPISDDEETEGRDCKVIDMEWEEGRFLDVETEDVVDNSSEMDDESEPILEFSLDDNTEDNEVLKEVCKEESASFEEDLSEENTELNLEIGESGQVYDGLTFDQLSSTEDGFEELSENEKQLRLDEETESMHAFMDGASTEERIEEQIEKSEERNMVSELEDVINLTGVTDEDPCNNTQDGETSSQVCDASENGKQNEQVDDSDLSLESGNVFEEADEDPDDAKVSEEVPLSYPSKAPSEADQVAAEAEESRANIETLDHNKKMHTTTFDDSVDHSDVTVNESDMEEDDKSKIGVTKVEIETKQEKKPALLCVEQASDDQELRNKWNRSRRGIKNLEESTRNFNPREPNYLPLVAEPEAEKVDLKHQMMDERKNSEEWMSDYALQRTVTKLAPARKKKVALLVEAFEAVTPVTKFESHRRSHHHHHHHSQAFPHTIRPIQACS